MFLDVECAPLLWAVGRPVISTSGSLPMSDYQETLYEGYGQRFRMEKCCTKCVPNTSIW